MKVVYLQRSPGFRSHHGRISLLFSACYFAIYQQSSHGHATNSKHHTKTQCQKQLKQLCFEIDDPLGSFESIYFDCICDVHIEHFECSENTQIHCWGEDIRVEHLSTHKSKLFGGDRMPSHLSVVNSTILWQWFTNVRSLARICWVTYYPINNQPMGGIQQSQSLVCLAIPNLQEGYAAKFNTCTKTIKIIYGWICLTTSTCWGRNLQLRFGIYEGTNVRMLWFP